ncbi:hypothetical protein GGH94_005654, partial [Coemansia aciculifera]
MSDVALEQPTDDVFASPAIEYNVGAFVQRIKQMAPTMKRVVISLGFYLACDPQFPVQPFSSIVAQLSQHAVDIEYNMECQPVIVDQQMTGLCSLVYSSFNSTYEGEQIMQLARRNALTLQALDIPIVTTANVTGLIQNDDDSY